MSSKSLTALEAVLGLAMFAMFVCGMLAVSGLITALCLGYTVNHWLIYCHKAASFPYWAGFVMGAIPKLGPRICGLAILSTVATFIVMFFL